MIWDRLAFVPSSGFMLGGVSYFYLAQNYKNEISFLS